MRTTNSGGGAARPRSRAIAVCSPWYEPPPTRKNWSGSSRGQDGERQPVARRRMTISAPTLLRRPPRPQRQRNAWARRGKPCAIRGPVQPSVLRLPRALALPHRLRRSLGLRRTGSSGRDVTLQSSTLRSSGRRCPRRRRQVAADQAGRGSPLSSGRRQVAAFPRGFASAAVVQVASSKTGIVSPLGFRTRNLFRAAFGLGGLVSRAAA